MANRTSSQIDDGLDDSGPHRGPTPRYRHLATSTGRASTLSDVRHFGAGLVTPGGAFLAAGLLVPGAAVFLATDLVARFDLPVALGLWVVASIVGAVVTATRRHGPVPSVLEVAVITAVLPVLGGLLAGSVYLALAGAGQLANRCVGRAAAFFALQAMLVVVGGAGPLLLCVAGLAAVEAVTTAWIESGPGERAHDDIDDDQ
ncbi:MAG: hypothetical protein ACYCTE_16395 [Acidimicrobiales bacterium]